MFYDILKYYILFGCVVGLIESFVFLLKGPRFFYTFINFLILSVFNIIWGLIHLGVVRTYPVLAFWDIPLFFLMGPLQYLSNRVTLDDEYQVPLWLKLSFLPTFILFPVIMIMHLSYPDEIRIMLNHLYEWKNSDPFLLMYLLAPFHLLLYYILDNTVKMKIWRSMDVPKGIWAHEIIESILLFVILSLMIIFWFYDYPTMIFWGNVIGASLFLTAIFGYMSNVDTYFKNIKKNRAIRRNIKKFGNDLQTRFENLLREEKIYLMEDLTISAMASLLDTNTDTLSLFVNHTYKQNFKGLINRYRILEAEDLIKSRDKPDILRIAFDVGFGSYSTFHRAFLKEHGVSPGAYVRDLKGAGFR